MEKKKSVKKTTKKVNKPTKKVNKPTKKVTKTTTSSKKKQKKKGFTLIELLAVIIILGILMIIAIPSVTRYINDSRKSAYIDTAKDVVAGTRNLVNAGDLEMYDTNTTYYIPASYIKTENALKSPYGEFKDNSAYVGVIYNGDGYRYYWISSDETGQGIDKITPLEELDTDDIKSDLKPSDIYDTVKTTGIGKRSEIKILKSNGTWEDYNSSKKISEDGEIVPPKICVTRDYTSESKRMYFDYTPGITVDDFFYSDAFEFEEGEMLHYFYDNEFAPCYNSNPYSTSTEYQQWAAYDNQCKQYKHNIEENEIIKDSNIGCYFVGLPK